MDFKLVIIRDSLNSKTVFLEAILVQEMSVLGNESGWLTHKRERVCGVWCMSRGGCWGCLCISEFGNR